MLLQLQGESIATAFESFSELAYRHISVMLMKPSAVFQGIRDVRREF